MRIGEIQALQLQHVHLDATTKWIQIAHGWRHVEGISRPKWGLDHPAPIDDKVAKWLGLVIGLSGSTEPEDLVFHGDWISELRRRNLPQHVVRYFAGLPPMRRQDPNPIAALHDRLVRYLTGHQSDATEGCTHVGLDDLTPVSLIKELIAKTNYDVGDGPHKN
jgi:integrase